VLSLTMGCGNFFVYPGSLNGSSNSGDYVYVANSSTENLGAYAVGKGTLTAISGSPYSLGFVPTAVAVNPANTLVFVAGGNGAYGFINSYSIGTGGVLTLLVSNPIGVGGEVAMDVSPDGNWLVGLDSNGATVNQAILDEYAINTSTGALTVQSNTGGVVTYTGSQIPTILPRAVKFAPNGDYVFVALGTAGDLVYTFTTSSGAFSNPLTLGISTNQSDNALAVNSSSSYLYIARSGTNGGLAVYAIGSGGALSPVTGSPFTAGSQPYSVAINKAATEIYVANQVDGTVSAYSLSSSGAVAVQLTDTLTAAPRALVVDNSGDYLLSASNAGNPDLALYSFDATTAGKLDFVTSTATGTDPTNPVALAATH
jgi:6-phosphogluconolactonase (cycloisomerase 2 family)